MHFSKLFVAVVAATANMAMAAPVASAESEVVARDPQAGNRNAQADYFSECYSFALARRQTHDDCRA